MNRSQNGETGRNVVNALQLDDGSLLLVNRGFVPDADDVPAAPQGPVEVVGRLRVSERRATGQTADQSGDTLTEIRRIDIDVLSQQFDEPMLPLYVEQLDSTPPDAASLQPIVAPTLDEGPAPVVRDPVVHLQRLRRRRLGAGGSPLDRHALRQADEEAKARLHPHRRRRLADLTSGVLGAALEDGHAAELLDDVR